MNVSRLLVDAASNYGKAECMISGKKRIDFNELKRMAGGVCGYLKSSGIRQGDRVIIMWHNGPEYAALFFGVLMAGGVAVPLNPASYDRNIKTLASHSSAKFIAASERAVGNVIGWWQGPPVISEIEKSGGTTAIDNILGAEPPKEIPFANVCPGDLAMILYTSGTTGSPKGVMLSHRNLLANTRSILSYLPISRSDRTLAILPFYYSYGNSLLLTHLSVGAALVVENGFAFVNKALKTMAAERVTGFSGVPSHFAVLIARSNFLDQEWTNLRYLTCAGGGLPPVHIRMIRERLPDVKLFVMYGQTEGTARLSSLHPDQVENKIGSVGKGIPGVELRVVDFAGNNVKSGEIGMVIARGDNIMEGYLADPIGTAEVLKNGWLYTGDMGTMDEENFIYIKGRSVEFIKSGGYRISPKEIEEVILQHSSVLECAVVGQPDEFLGESLVAVVVPREEGEKENLVSSLSHFMASNIPQYMMPRRYIIVDSIPKTESGKIKRIELRDRIINVHNTLDPERRKII